MRKREHVAKDWTTLTVLKDTIAQLKEMGKKAETYDTIIKRLIKEHNENIQVSNLSK